MADLNSKIIFNPDHTEVYDGSGFNRYAIDELGLMVTPECSNFSKRGLPKTKKNTLFFKKPKPEANTKPRFSTIETIVAWLMVSIAVGRLIYDLYSIIHN